MSPEAQRPYRLVSEGIGEILSAGGTPRGASVRRWAVGLFAAGLLLGPVTYDFVPAGWLRIAVLVLASTALWLGLIWFWKRWRPDYAAETRFGRALAGVVAGAFLATSALTTQDTTHYECTHRVQTRDGSECVGDYVELPGADKLEILFFAGLAATAFWISVSMSPWKTEAGD